ncbi:hypothetical protein HNR05_002443 [Leifsonia psychrotolerans]|uniref:Uncharacterized protein n=1 Tax=Glaciibacter psychrotolerans TaxID=670054 RepID=A0A7Z0EFD0_9MICO|nr:hypothetical protein [Leifsonia psychrotolerans]
MRQAAGEAAGEAAKQAAKQAHDDDEISIKRVSSCAFRCFLIVYTIEYEARGTASLWRYARRDCSPGP